MGNRDKDAAIHSTDPESKEGQDLFERLAEIAHSDASPEVRSEAQRALKELYPDGKQGFDDMVSKLIEGLKDHADERKSTTCAVGLMGLGEMAIPYVRPLLEDPDPKVRRLAVRILAQIEQDQATIAPSHK
jgi:HEAT repeat protein